MLLNDLPIFWLVALFVLGALTFTLSTISGGGGAMLQIPVLNFFLGTAQTAPIINLGAFISRPSRIIIFLEAHSLEGLLVLRACGNFGCFACRLPVYEGANRQGSTAGRNIFGKYGGSVPVW
jgi:uncharacterized membrane protein YfcA